MENVSQSSQDTNIHEKQQTKNTETSWKALALVAAFVLVFAVLIANLIVTV